MSLRLPRPRDVGIVLLQLALVVPAIVYVYVRQVLGSALRRHARDRDIRAGKRHPVGRPGRADAPSSTDPPGPSARFAPTSEGPRP